MARFLINVLLASGVSVDDHSGEDRADYLHALDRVTIEVDLRPFASFIAKQVRGSLKKA